MLINNESKPKWSVQSQIKKKKKGRHKDIEKS